MPLIVFVVIVIVLLALAWLLIDQIPKIDGFFKNILRILAILAAIVVICQRAGFLDFK